jgi:hypothetical protein
VGPDALRTYSIHFDLPLSVVTRPVAARKEGANVHRTLQYPTVLTEQYFFA